MTVLTTAYFPPVSYFSLLKGGEVFLEACENYQKQSWRNRCMILSANGPEALQVPVVHSGGSARHPIREIRVDYSRGFMVRHQRAIDSAYMSSPFFEHYRDGLYSIMDSKPEYLWDLNYQIISYFAKALGLPVPGLTSEYAGPTHDIHPKHPDPVYVPKPYFQVFSQKYGFVPNLSIMDLVFNEGPYAEL